ncbi:hypothetical protein QAD02_019707 [Eretmocerus hayati]|uniref:Uncharacterized protein n=1 Tax=Eretmocerus hayati TaxID=131215 RepID=A0ACC2PKH4_9HYME|nr:hypothetical protein QAD02_019707 [Eretmocerus hayati]
MYVHTYTSTLFCPLFLIGAHGGWLLLALTGTPTAQNPAAPSCSLATKAKTQSAQDTYAMRILAHFDKSRTLAVHRSKRQKTDKTGRLSALEKLRQLKGSKNKYQVDELDSVYDEVDEEVYGKTVLNRQCDDWIVDDGGGSGYVEDGREIFDDDLDDESVRQAEKRDQHKGPRKRKRDAEAKKGSNIVNMFSNMAGKKKTEDLASADDILDDLMSELKKESSTADRKSTPRVNKFASAKKVSSALNDEILLANMVKETEKSKNNRNDLDNECMFDKPEKTISRPKPTSEKLKSVQPPKMNEPSVKETETFPEVVAESVPFDDDFTSDSFPDIHDVVQESSVSNGSSHQNSQSKSNGQDVNLFMEDISDVDFGNAEMDTAQSVSNLKIIDKSQMWKEKDADLPKDDVFAKVWEEDFNISNDQDPLSKPVADEKMLPLPTTVNSAGEKVFRFFWLDAFEDPYKHPGVVYLFGKVFVDSLNEYVSCTLCIKNIPRRIYLLPREYIKTDSGEGKEPNNMQNVYTEFNSYARRQNIQEFRSIEVTKSYAFEREGTPLKAEYLEVRYSAADPAVDPDYSGQAIEAVFGTSVNALELFLIERNIKGPCWLEVKCPLPVENPFSWCKVQANCTKMDNVSVYIDSGNNAMPPIVMATINVQVSLDSKLQKNEIVNIGLLLHHKFQLDKAPPKPPFDSHYCLVTHPKNATWPMKSRERLSKITQTQVIRCETELDLLEKFLSLLQCSDPDIIVGYDCGFQFEVLMNKIFTLKVKNWSCVGKLRRTMTPNFKGKLNLGQIFCGRPICDITSSAKELNLKVKSYDLASLCVAVLHKKEYECKEIKPEDCPKYYFSAEKLENLIQTTMVEATYILGIVVELNVLPLALQITNIAGNTLSRTLSAGRAERNEFLLLHAFHQKGYITPDKKNFNKKKESNEATKAGKKKPAYAGGLVLDPKKGFYDKLILLMDFNSLYPSIIQEFNLCFTTVAGAAYDDVDNLALPEGAADDGIVPTEIRKLVESRQQVKKLMKAPNLSPELSVQYNIRQLALKLTANSMYGCLGATHCRFYAKGLAALTTMKGREILQNTKSLVEKLNYEVIYGDTDSIMINTNILEYDQVFNIGRELKKEVNKTYKKVELDIDGVFRYLLLLQKKKYAAVTMSKLPNGQLQYTKELKGLDIVRRDWCGLACDIGNQILDQLLSDQSSEERLGKIFEILTSVGNKLREGKFPLSSLVITKQLSKNPNEYPTDKKLSHVLVALRLNESGGRKWKAGDTVPYIICEDGTDKTPLERAYHIEEFKKGDNLRVDINYYLLNQIHPVILRICEPIEGIDDVLLAQHLGVGDLYKPKKVYNNQDENEVPLCIQDNRYDNCAPFKFICRNDKCLTENEIKTTITEFAGVPRPSLAMCSNPDCEMAPFKYAYAIQNKLQLDIRKLVTEYYYGEVECENPICSKIMRRVTMDTKSTFPKCYNCLDGNVHRIHKETELFNQLSFYLHIFTLTQAHLKSLKVPRELSTVYDTLKEFVEKQIQYNAYSVVDLTKLFWPSLQESNVDVLSEVEDVIPTIEVEDLGQDQDEDEVRYQMIYFRQEMRVY